MVASELARVVRVVAVSPGDVRVERERLETVVDELNHGVAPACGCRLSLWRWETDAHPGLHLEGPQGLIDDAMRIEDADVVVGIFWKRFGTPTMGAGSGTEHELRRAFLTWRERGRPQVMVYFCERKYMPTNAAEAAQLQRVLSFREAMPKEQLWWRYATVADFERAVRKHLTDFVLALEQVPIRAAQAIAVRAARRVRFRLPLAVAHFTGRTAELDAIDEALGVAERAVVTQAITGLGGVGKSRLAARYVHQHAHDYDVVAWIRAEDGGIADLSELACALDLPVAQLTLPERAASVLRWLGGCEERWLLVLDNVAAPGQLRDCCPSAGNGRVIVTTRHRGMAQFGPALHIDVLDDQTAVEYLLATSGRAEDRDGAARLAHALGCLPLALSHAGAYCAAGTSFDDYRELLEALPAADLFASHPGASYAQTVASTWQVSIQAADREAPLARQVLAMAAHLAPDAIPRELFDVLLDDAAGVAARKPLLDAFNALHRLSLVQVDDAAISLHRLLQKTIRDDALEHGDATAAVRALTAVAAALPSDHDQPLTWPQCERLLPHALAISASALPPGKPRERLVRLLNSGLDYLLRADPGARLLDAAHRASEVAQQYLGPEHPDTLDARSNLVMSYRETGRTTDAVELGQRVLADCERILGPEHPDTLSVRAVLAGAYREAGRTGDAIRLGEQAVSERERILGPRHPDTLSIHDNLALSYRSAGRTDEAIELEQRVLAEREQILGQEHPATLRARRHLALSYLDAGRIADAVGLGERVLADSERILGPEHPDTLRDRGYLATSYGRAGRTGDAIELGAQALTESERILGLEHPDTLGIRGSLAESYREAGRTGEAQAIEQHARRDVTDLRRPELYRSPRW